MQQYAIDKSGTLVSVHYAVKSTTYQCHECGSDVRVRSGFRFKPHYYHFRGVGHCRQAGKGEQHLAVQKRLLALLPEGSAEMEFRFPEIKRVADVAWHDERIVFEVQCASLSGEEALARTRDYRKAGWHVVWVLHTERYGGRMMSELESVLEMEGIPHYYTDINMYGKGDLFDQIVIWRDGYRYLTTKKKVLDKLEVGAMREVSQLGNLPEVMRKRVEMWGRHLIGDYLTDIEMKVMEELLLVEKSLVPRSFWEMGLKERFFWRPLRIWFQWMLESCCSKN